MDLCVFAHRGEAQAFIKGLKSIAPHLYQGDYYVLITGEGVWEATALGFYLAKLKPTRVLNFGIAGSLNAKIPLESIYEVRTHYLYETNSPQFKSYSNNTSSQLDCITTFQRVLTEEFALRLSPFADLVDREAWMYAQVSNKANIPFFCFKLVSDFAGSKTDCFDLKARALDFSESLFEFYQNFENAEPTKESYSLPFHCSFSQKKRIEKILKSIEKKYGITQIEIFDKLTIPTHKSEVNDFIKQLEMQLNPLVALINDKLQELKDPFEKIGAQLHFDPKLEKQSFRLSMEINNSKNIENLIQVLKEFEYRRVEQLWSGDV